MASTAMTGMAESVAVGRVFGRSIAVIKDNPLATLGTTFALIALPQLLIALTGQNLAMVGNLRSGAYAVVAVYGLFVSVLWLVASGAIVQATVAHEQGRPASPTDMIRIGVLRCLPLIAVYILLLIGVWIGMLFLLIPGIMLAVRWSVALPSIVAEKTGVFGAFKRSAYLTKGARWHVFGILLLAFVVYILILLGFSIVSGASSGSLAALTNPNAMRAPSLSIFAQIIQTLVTTVIATWMTTVGASLFVELRRWKDGPDADRLADIFA